jgi:hypothetical protein
VYFIRLNFLLDHCVGPLHGDESNISLGLWTPDSATMNDILNAQAESAESLLDHHADVDDARKIISRAMLRTVDDWYRFYVNYSAFRLSSSLFILTSHLITNKTLIFIRCRFHTNEDIDMVLDQGI